MVVLAGGWAGFEVWRAVRGDQSPAVLAGHRAGAQYRDGVRRGSLAPPKGLLPARVRGREELLTALDSLVNAPDGRLHVLCGLGGCGKTTVALTAAGTAAASGARVWWITARDETSLTSDLVDLAVELGATPEEVRYAGAGVRSLTDLVWQRIEAVPGRWVLVVDNADQPDLLAAEGGRVGDGNGAVRGSARGLVLVTSRSGGAEVWGGVAMLHPVGPLGDHDGGQVLCDLAPHAGTTQEAAGLAVRLGGLPLALHAAGRYLGSARARLDQIPTFAAYRRAVDAKFTTLLSDATGSARPREAVMTTWELSLDLLAQQGLPQARALMRLVGGFAPATIPVSVLDGPALFASKVFVPGAAGGAGRGGRLAVIVRAAAGVSRRRTASYGLPAHQRTVIALCELGLLDLTTGTALTLAGCVSAHPLVTEANAALLADRPALARAVHTTVAGLLSQATRGRDPRDPDEYPMWPLLAPHLAHALTHTTPYLSRAAIAALIDAASTTIWGLLRAGDYLTEYTLAAVAAETAVHHLPANHPASIKARNRLADALKRRGLYGEAEAEFHAALPAQQRVLGADHPQTLESRRSRADLMAKRGLYEPARAEFQAVLSACVTVLGTDHPDTLHVRHNLADVLFHRGLYEEAEAEFRAVRDVQRRVLGDAHPETLHTGHHLAEVLTWRGLHTEAETEFRAILDTQRQVLGDDHPDSLDARADHAVALTATGHYERSQEEHQSVLDVQRRVLGDDHPDTLRTRRSHADLLALRGQRDQAEAEYQSVLDAQRRELGDTHPDVSVTRAAIEQAQTSRSSPPGTAP